MRLKGQMVQAAPINLDVLQVWLGRLLELPEPPSVAECTEGRVVLAGLHKVLSRQPLVSQSATNILHAGTPKANIFQTLATELREAGLGQHEGLLDAVAEGDRDALEALLIAIYQHYAVNHAHKFSMPSTPQPSARAAQGGEAHYSSSSSPDDGGRRDSGNIANAFSQQLVASLTAVTPRNHQRESRGSPFSARSSRHRTPVVPSRGGEEGQDAGSPGLSSPDGETAKDYVERLLMGEGLPSDANLVATQACLAAWLGSVAGRQDPVGRMLLGDTTQQVKITMLANGAAHRSALAALLGYPPPGRHATARAIVNTTEVLDGLESAGYQVFHKLRRQCVTELDGLSLKSQMVLGAVVLQVALQRRVGAEGEVGVLDWARGLLLEAGLLPPADAGQGAWGQWSWGALHALAAHCLQAPDGTAGASEADSFHKLDSLCSARGVALPFGLTDLPTALPGNIVMQLVFTVFLADLRSVAGPAATSMPSSPLADPPAVELSCEVMQQDTTAEEGSVMDLTVSDVTEAAYARSASSLADMSPARARSSHASPVPQPRASVSSSPAQAEELPVYPVGSLQENMDILRDMQESRTSCASPGGLAESLRALDSVVSSAEAMATKISEDTDGEGSGAVENRAASSAGRPSSRGGRFDEDLLLRASPARSGLRGSASVAESGRPTASDQPSVAASLPAGVHLAGDQRPGTGSRPPSSSRAIADTSREAIEGQYGADEALPYEDYPQRLSSYNGSVAEVLTVAQLSDEEEEEVHQDPSQLPDPSASIEMDYVETAISEAPLKSISTSNTFLGGQRRPATAGPTTSKLGGGGGGRRSTGRPLRPTTAASKSLRGSLVPVDMFAPPPHRSSEGRPESVPRPSDAPRRSSGFLQQNVFAPPQQRDALDCEQPTPEISVEKVEAESGIGRFRAKAAGSSAVSASVAHHRNRGFCPELSASTPSLEFSAPERQPPKDHVVDEELFADTLGPEEAAAMMSDTRSTLVASKEGSPVPLPDEETVEEEDSTRSGEDDAEAVAAVQQLPVLELSDGLLAHSADFGDADPPAAGDSVRSLGDSIEALDVTLNPRQAGAGMPTMAEIEAYEAATTAKPSASEAARGESPTERAGPSADQYAEVRGAQATPSRQRDDLHAGSHIPPPSPQILASSAGVAGTDTGRGHHHRDASREILACGAGVPEEIPISRLPRLPPRPAVEAPVAFDVGALTMDEENGADADDEDAKAKEEQRLRRVQAMLDAKRERFLQERKEKEAAAAERAAREERQRKALATAREKEAAERGRNARRAAEAAAIARAQKEAQRELGMPPSGKASVAAIAPISTEVSVIAPMRSRDQVLAETTLPLEEHLAKLVATAVEPAVEEGEAVREVSSSDQPMAVPRKAQSARAQTGTATSGVAHASRNPTPPSFSRASNRKLVRNALAHVCLAGGARVKEKEAALAAIDAYKGDDSFIVLFKGSSAPLHFKGLYLHPRDGGPVARLYGKGPDSVDPQRVATYFKYDSGAREFRAMQTTTFNFGTTCGIAQS